MEIFLVGGAVRDLLLGRVPKDKDFVVVGATEEEFLAAYPTAVRLGKAFPVYHVKFGESVYEFAFARKERKTGSGHLGFEVVADPSVTLTEDLSRRDLTINAMAMPAVYAPGCAPKAFGASKVIDIYGGQKDLADGLLRHVSEAFAEDPLRVFRLARFAAQLGFSVALETRDFICLDNVLLRELFSLSGERIAEETRKAMRSDRPRIYFETLLDLLALGQWFPELLQLVGTPAGPIKHHAETDSFVHTMMVLDKVTAYTDMLDEPEDVKEMARWAALTHDLGKGITPREEWPSHFGHETRGIHLVHRFYDRIKMPTQFKDAAAMVCAEHMKVHILLKMKAEKWVDLVRHADRTKLMAEGLSLVVMGDAMGREAEHKSVEGPVALHRIANPIRETTGQPVPAHLKGERIGQYIRKAKAIAAKRALDEEPMTNLAGDPLPIKVMS